jgi:iron complex outermembrane receptor protein
LPFRSTVVAGIQSTKNKLGDSSMNHSIDRSIRRALRSWALLPLVGACFAPGAYAAQGASDDSGLEEVVVTAQFREQRLQDTPIAITAVNAEMLEQRNQTSLAKVAEQAPNVILTETGGAFGPGVSARIRGIGQGDYIAALEPGVGIYIDDVYYPSLTGANFDLLDLDRVEILRGPQGTLAGRNSEGGAIKMYSAKPKGDGTGSVRGTYGSRNLLDLRAMGDFTVIPDALFARISGVSRQQDGYVTRLDYGCVNPGNGVPNRTLQGDCFLGREGGKDYSAGRVALRWLASDTVEVNLSGDLMEDNSEVAANVLRRTGPVAPGVPIGTIPWDSRYVPADPYVSYADFTNVRPDGTYVVFGPYTHTKVWGSNLSVDWTLNDSMAIKSITAYREFDSRWTEDNDTSPAYLGLGAEHQSNHSFSQELRLSGKAGTLLDYTVGAYYFDQTTIGRTHQMLNYAIPGLLFEFLGNDPTVASSYAGFANASLHFLDSKLNLNTGVRYTKESKDYTFSRKNPDGTPNIIIGTLTGVTGSYDGNKFDYRVNLDYRWNDALMTYASVSTGFKGGGINPRPFNVPQVRPFGPEELTAYEIGAKSDFFDRKLRVNVSGFINKYKDIQVTLLACPTAPCALPANAGNADIKGYEVEIEAEPLQGLQFDASYSDLSFEYTYLAANTGIPVGSTAPGTIKNKWSVGAQYEVALANGSSITPRFDFSFQGGYNTNAIPTTGNRVGGYHLGNARVTWKSADDSWQAALQAANVFDQYYFYSVFDLTGLGGGANYGMVAPPREISVQVQKKF